MTFKYAYLGLLSLSLTACQLPTGKAISNIKGTGENSSNTASSDSTPSANGESVPTVIPRSAPSVLPSSIPTAPSTPVATPSSAPSPSVAIDTEFRPELASESHKVKSISLGNSGLLCAIMDAGAIRCTGQSGAEIFKIPGTTKWNKLAVASYSTFLASEQKLRVDGYICAISEKSAAQCWKKLGSEALTSLLKLDAVAEIATGYDTSSANPYACIQYLNGRLECRSFKTGEVTRISEKSTRFTILKDEMDSQQLAFQSEPGTVRVRGPLNKDGTAKEVAVKVPMDIQSIQLLRDGINSKLCYLSRENNMDCAVIDWSYLTAGQFIQAYSSISSAVHFTSGICKIDLAGKVFCKGGSSHVDPWRNMLSAGWEIWDIQARDLQANGSTVCAITSSNDLICKGYLARIVGELAARPGARDVLDQVKDFSVGFSHACALIKNGDVYCWGMNRNGEVDHSDPQIAINVPRKVASDAKKVVASGTLLNGGNTCVLKNNGDLLCWGASQDAKDTVYYHAPKIVDRAVLDVSANDNLFCAKKSDQMSCFVMSEISLKQKTNFPANIVSVGISAGVKAGIVTVCTQSDAGVLSCNENGSIRTLSSQATQFNFGFGAPCWVNKDQKAYCEFIDSKPVFENIVAIDNQYAGACMLSSDHTVRCIPSSNSTANSGFNGMIAEELNKLSGITSVGVAGAAEFACALSSSGALRCAGDAIGLGNDSKALANKPVAMVKFLE